MTIEQIKNQINDLVNYPDKIHDLDQLNRIHFDLIRQLYEMVRLFSISETVTDYEVACVFSFGSRILSERFEIARQYIKNHLNF